MLTYLYSATALRLHERREYHLLMHINYHPYNNNHNCCQNKDLVVKILALPGRILTNEIFLP